MNTDTIRGVNKIREQGYWQQGTTFGEGGWSAVYVFAGSWKQYELWDADSPSCKPTCIIYAASNEAARKAFAELFRLDDFEWGIYKITRESKRIASSEGE